MLITARLVEMTAHNPFMQKVTAHLFNAVPTAKRDAFNLHLLDSVGPAFALEDPSLQMNVAMETLKTDAVLDAMIMEFLADMVPVALDEERYPALARLSPDQLKAKAADSLTTFEYSVFRTHACRRPHQQSSKEGEKQ
ncbi:hypothetical protein AMAG_05954 [Allomyces macrogynus ATCC 38327]|uniref:Uncharacterized protein n=1 Tax=Allomyces macrogynus (strain ATCC 38327) TaxID=578462 RepID=A0A0L0SDS1_ALLM3|nr:hypothetical protein AMAG_05954 [Allomyces macrogynus ATCC 38327]|eukprot:KNE60574.1 hypothetical protein AMAG_05954 [Allomyces macrogynus ATCC 38327]